MRSSSHKKTPGKPVASAKPVKAGVDVDKVMQLRSLAHDLSNSLEAI